MPARRVTTRTPAARARKHDQWRAQRIRGPQKNQRTKAKRYCLQALWLRVLLSVCIGLPGASCTVSCAACSPRIHWQSLAKEERHVCVARRQVAGECPVRLCFPLALALAITCTLPLPVSRPLALSLPLPARALVTSTTERSTATTIAQPRAPAPSPVPTLRLALLRTIITAHVLALLYVTAPALALVHALALAPPSVTVRALAHILRVTIAHQSAIMVTDTHASTWMRPLPAAPRSFRLASSRSRRLPLQGLPHLRSPRRQSWCCQSRTPLHHSRSPRLPQQWAGIRVDPQLPLH